MAEPGEPGAVSFVSDNNPEKEGIKNNIPHKMRTEEDLTIDDGDVDLGDNKKKDLSVKDRGTETIFKDIFAHKAVLNSFSGGLAIDFEITTGEPFRNG